MRLAKFLAHAGVASRRAAEQLVFGGRVTVGGEVVRDPARDVSEDADVTVDGGRSGAERRVVLRRSTSRPASSRPRTTRTAGKTVVDLVPRRPRACIPVGRLDADSTGLILLTDDGELAHRLTHPSFEVPTHLPRHGAAGPPVREPALRALREGVELEDGRTSPARCARLALRRARDHDPRGPQAPGAADVRGGRPSGESRSSASRSGRCGSAGWRPGEHRRLTPRRGRSCGGPALIEWRAHAHSIALRGATTVAENDADAILPPPRR